MRIKEEKGEKGVGRRDGKKKGRERQKKKRAKHIHNSHNAVE